MLGLSETTFPFGWHYKSLSVSTSSVCFGILCPPFIIKQSLNRYNQVLSHRISYCKIGCQQRFMLEVSGTPCFISNHGKITVMHCLSCSFAFCKAGYGSVGCVFVLSGVSLCHRRAERCVWCCDQGVALRYTHSLSASLSLSLSHRSFSLSLLEQMDQIHGAALTAETERGKGMGTAIFSAGHTLPPCVWQIKDRRVNVGLYGLHRPSFKVNMKPDLC